MRDLDPKNRRIVTILIVSIALLMLGATMVVASHNFSDVPTSAFYHSAVDWGVDRGITSGCGSGRFCPNDPLTRGQGMTLMRNLAGVIGPSFVNSEAGPANVDLDSASPLIVCATGLWKRPYEQVAYGFARSTLDRGATPNPVAYVGKVAYRVNDTGAWIIMPPTVSSTSQSNTAGESIHNVHFSTLNLAPNTNYRFGIKLEPRDGLSSGNADPEGQASCALTMQIFNRPL
jgi:hypothetical protein